jgi:hypothetical protein
MALARSAVYPQNLIRYHSRKVNPRVFWEGDLVLLLVQRTAGMHKPSPPLEGPFIVSKALHNDAYYLIDVQDPRKNVNDRSGEETKRPWNAALLHPFFSWRHYVGVFTPFQYLPWMKIPASRVEFGDCLYCAACVIYLFRLCRLAKLKFSIPV